MATHSRQGPDSEGKSPGEKKKRDNSDSSEDSSDDIIVDDSEIVPKTAGKTAAQCQAPRNHLRRCDIKRSLYPPCGPNASTQKGGGKPKVNAQWEVAVALLGDIEKYKDAIAACDTPKEKLVFANKIKNRLSSMAKTTRDYDKVMGATGAGIKNAADINKDSKNKFTTKWPRSLPTAPATKKTKLAEFSDIAKNEEKTRQKELELAQLRTRQQIKALEVKGRFLEKREDRRQLEKQAKRDERMQKLKLKELKLRQAHELKMAATKTGSTSATSHAASLYDSHSRASGSHYSSSEAADYADADYDGFNMNGMAGPSTTASE
ncbi:hypothetical protein B0H13DRAFT_2328479 [Mycena leptocephala]|nr:hypothetical protein B0H13DRAFT_2328479 [Mycena leptocephala]